MAVTIHCCPVSWFKDQLKTKKKHVDIRDSPMSAKKANRRHTYIFESQVSPAPDLTRDSLVGFRWLGVSFRWYCGVGGLVVGH